MFRKKKIISVVGARPNFIKLAPFYYALKRYNHLFDHRIVHTGQHYDFHLSEIFFKDLNIPKPHWYLEAGSSSQAKQTAVIMKKFEELVLRYKPDLVIVYGDVNSTLACSLVCSKILYNENETLPVAHIEAGLRSFDKTMPEEVNRIVTDCIAKYHFVTEKAGVENLSNEGIPKKNIYLTGDVMIDALIQILSQTDKEKLLKKYKIDENYFAVLTFHRPSNVDDKKSLFRIVKIAKTISELSKNYYKNFKLIFSVHPRTMKNLRNFELLKMLSSIPEIIITNPIGYSDFMGLLSMSKLIMTDSGGIQSEATYLKKPCLTLRDSFEKPETFSIGSNTLCGLDEDKIIRSAEPVFKDEYKKIRVPKLMDGKASERISSIIYSIFSTTS